MTENFLEVRTVRVSSLYSTWKLEIKFLTITQLHSGRTIEHCQMATTTFATEIAYCVVEVRNPIRDAIPKVRM